VVSLQVGYGARVREGYVWVMADRLGELRGLIGDILHYPIIPTEPHPITVITVLVAALVVVTAFWIFAAGAGDPSAPDPHSHAPPTRPGVLDPPVHPLRRPRAFRSLRAQDAARRSHRSRRRGGILSVGIGFGLQNLASNFISGSSCSSSGHHVGDHVSVGDVDGLVRAINMRSTEIGRATTSPSSFRTRSSYRGGS